MNELAQQSKALILLDTESQVPNGGEFAIVFGHIPDGQCKVSVGMPVKSFAFIAHIRVLLGFVFNLLVVNLKMCICIKMIE